MPCLVQSSQLEKYLNGYFKVLLYFSMENKKEERIRKIIRILNFYTPSLEKSK